MLSGIKIVQHFKEIPSQLSHGGKQTVSLLQMKDFYVVVFEIRYARFLFDLPLSSLESVLTPHAFYLPYSICFTYQY